ncbi:MAG: hypothetical protein KF804_05310 [Burkholderiales bacterium]|nr:hypothetical protein [Burkholderiales bacterium]
MVNRNFVVLSAAIFTLTACDQISGRHDIVRAGNQTFLINKATGEAKLIDGTTLVAVKALEPTASGEPFKKAKTWPEQSINDLQGVKFKLRTKYRDGAILWIVEAGPFSGDLEKVYKATQPSSVVQPTVMLELYDDEGFKIGEPIEFKIRHGSRTVNSKNEVMELNWSGAQPMTPDTYRSAAFVNTRWYGFK